MAVHAPLPQPALGSVAMMVSPTHVRLLLAGELDLAIKAELLVAVREAARYDRPVEVDTRRVTFMDSSALAALSRLIQRTNRRPIFISPPEVVRFLLEVTKICDLVDIVEHDGELPATTADRPSSPATTSA